MITNGFLPLNRRLVSALILTPQHHHQSQHYFWWSVLGIPCLWRLNFYSCYDNSDVRMCQKALAICFVWHLLQQLSFLSGCSSCWRVSAFLFMTVHLICLCSGFPCEKTPFLCPASASLFSLVECETLKDQRNSSSPWYRKAGRSFKIRHRFLSGCCS